MRILLIIFYILLLISCNQEKIDNLGSQISVSEYEPSNCNELPAYFNNYKHALEKVKSASFKISDKINTYKSIWIRGASFYSCDSQTGFLIIETDKKEYIHQDVPINVWNNFKKAGSFGSYYSSNIKGKYKIKIKDD